MRPEENWPNGSMVINFAMKFWKFCKLCQKCIEISKFFSVNLVSWFSINKQPGMRSEHVLESFSTPLVFTILYKDTWRWIFKLFANKIISTEARFKRQCQSSRSWSFRLGIDFWFRVRTSKCNHQSEPPLNEPLHHHETRYPIIMKLSSKFSQATPTSKGIVRVNPPR